MQPVSPPGVPLDHYRQHDGGVILTCLDCQRWRLFGLEAVIARLRARGVGGAATGVREVARHVREPCPHCGGARFDSRPHFPTRPKGDAWTATGFPPHALRPNAIP